MLHDPHLIGRGVFSRIRDAAGEFTGVNAPWRMSGTGGELRGHVPETGGDCDEALQNWLSLTDSEIRALRKAGTFGHLPVGT
jgi:crotonobetainyl-CoA:carnitine CoA-transferase CaiB-like acyl-CoA transferase